MASPSIKRTSVFICYSHNPKDARFFDELVEHLAYFERNDLLKVWSDKKITPGAQWREEIRQAIESTSVAVLLISPSFLASKFIAENELPPLLRAAEKEGAIILPVIVRPSYFEDTELANFQAVNNPSKPVAGMKGYERDALWTKVVKEIKKVVTPQQQSNTAIIYQKTEADVLIQTSFLTNTNTSPPVEEQIGQWLQEIGSDSKETKYTYQRYITQYRSFLREQGFDLDSDDEVAILSLAQAWADTAPKIKSVKASTYNQRISSIRSFYKYALTKGWILSNPLEKADRRKEYSADTPQPLEKERVKSILRSIPRNTQSGKRDYAILCILFTTGARAAEIVNLLCGHIAKTEKSITITTRQKGGKERSYLLKKYTAQALIDYLTAIYDTEYSSDAPVWLSFARNDSKGSGISKQTLSDICLKWLGISKVEVTYRTFEIIQKEYGKKGLENIEHLLGIEETEALSS